METVDTNCTSDITTVTPPTKINEILLYSSVVFITNVLSTYYYGDYVYCLLFCALTASSLMFHYNSNIYTNIIDKTCILGVVSYGGYVIYNKTTPENLVEITFVISTFIITIILFFYGYWTNSYCYHPDTYIGNKYHCMLHMISSFGHHLILLV